jgi:hypothetical protein
MTSCTNCWRCERYPHLLGLITTIRCRETGRLRALETPINIVEPDVSTCSRYWPISLHRSIV